MRRGYEKCEELHISRTLTFFIPIVIFKFLNFFYFSIFLTLFATISSVINIFTQYYRQVM